VAVLWLISTVSAAAAFPPAIAAPRRDEADALFVQARDAYLARDWVQTEARLQDLLTIAPTDGEAQLLHASLLRRTGRTVDAKKALEKLARSDSGAPWRHEIAAELDRLADSSERHAGEEPAVLPLRDESGGQNPRSAAA
jgi:predicted Zn-dependent protease